MALTSLFCLFLAAASASPIALLKERQSQQINIQVTVPESQFRTFENPNTLQTYLQSQGYSSNVSYAQLSPPITIIDQYFILKAAQTFSSTLDYGFPSNVATSPQTFTKSTSLKGGPSYTNNSMNANTDLVSIFSFSDGNAATAGGAIERTTTSSSTSSSGNSNSTATVTGGSRQNQIDVTSSVIGASDSRNVSGNPQDAFTAGDCAASSTGASARSSITSTITFPVNVQSPARGINSVASSFCEAGIAARSAGTPGGQGTSVSSTQASLTDGGVAAIVLCNGIQTSGTPNVMVGMSIQGSYSAGIGFAGTLTVARTASVSVNCI